MVISRGRYDCPHRIERNRRVRNGRGGGAGGGAGGGGGRQRPIQNGANHFNIIKMKADL